MGVWGGGFGVVGGWGWVGVVGPGVGWEFGGASVSCFFDFWVFFSHTQRGGEREREKERLTQKEKE